MIATMCSVGLIVQVTHVSSRYFEYATRTIVHMTIPISLPGFPAISTCWSINSMINRTQVKLVKKIKMRTFNRTSADNANFNKQISNFTIEELFKFTPNNDSILDTGKGKTACQVRTRMAYSPSKSNMNTCVHLFSVLKYLEREYVCYKFVPKVAKKLNMIRYAMSPSYTGEMYRFYLNGDIFKNIGAISTSIHNSISSQLFDSVFASNHFHIGHQFPALKVTFREIDTKLMKRPFDTECDELPANYTTGQEFSLDRVNEAVVKEFDAMTPFVPIHDRTLKYKLLQDLQFQNGTIIKRVNSLSEKYGNLRGCVTAFVDTTAELLDERRPYVAVYWPQDEKLSIIYVPDQELIDFVVYIGSCIGVWFGLSAYSVHDGIRFVWRLQKRQKNNSTNVSNRAFRVLNIRVNEIYRMIHRQQLEQLNVGVRRPHTERSIQMRVRKENV